MIDDVNPMRSREARSDLRQRVMDGIASGLERGALRHEIVLALLDLADEGETAIASADAYHAEMTARLGERDDGAEAREGIRLLAVSLSECVTALRHVCDGCWQPDVIARAEALLAQTGGER